MHVNLCILDTLFITQIFVSGYGREDMTYIRLTKLLPRMTTRPPRSSLMLDPTVLEVSLNSIGLLTVYKRNEMLLHNYLYLICDKYSIFDSEGMSIDYKRQMFDESVHRISTLLGTPDGRRDLEAVASLTHYGLGTKRNLDQLIAFTGVDLREKGKLADANKKCEGRLGNAYTYTHCIISFDENPV